MISRLSSGLPGTTAGPVSPPLRRPSRLSTSRPPLSFSAVLEWHLAHLVMSTGRILVSKNLTCSGVIGRSTIPDCGRLWPRRRWSRARPASGLLPGQCRPCANGPLRRRRAPPARSSLIRRNSLTVKSPS